MLALAILPVTAPGAVAAAPVAPAASAEEHRLLIVAVPTASDPRLRAQRRVIAGWRQGAADRDLILVALSGNAVASPVAGAGAGAGEGLDGAALRRRYALPQARFTVLLVGKDGHVVLREHRVLAASRLERIIDAMPMRRAGLR